MTSLEHPLRIGVLGAGAIGSYLGARLAATGNDVTLVGRAAWAQEIEAHGLTAIDLDGTSVRAPRERVTLATEASALAGCDVVLVCVKSAQTAEAGASIAALPSRPLVVSMQNGVRNADVLREAAPACTSLAGIVGWNVVTRGAGVYRRATSGPLLVEKSPDPRALAIVAALRATGLEVDASPEVRAQQWSKLILNLNNAVSALSDAPTRQIVLTPGYRKVVAAIMGEALEVMRAAGVRTARIGPLPVAVLPVALRLPTPLIRVVARAQLAIDPEARSSMWEDLARGRKTEVDSLNGEIVRLAASCGRRAPINARVVALVHEVEARGQGSPRLSPEALWRALVR